MATLSIITGGGKWIELTIPADCLPALLLPAEKKFWRCVQSGQPPRLFLSEPPKLRIDAVRFVAEIRIMGGMGRHIPATRAAFVQHGRHPGH